MKLFFYIIFILFVILSKPTSRALYRSHIRTVTIDLETKQFDLFPLYIDAGIKYIFENATQVYESEFECYVTNA